MTRFIESFEPAGEPFNPPHFEHDPARLKKKGEAEKMEIFLVKIRAIQKDIEKKYETETTAGKRVIGKEILNIDPEELSNSDRIFFEAWECFSHREITADQAGKLLEANIAQMKEYAGKKEIAAEDLGVRFDAMSDSRIQFNAWVRNKMMAFLKH